jgi:hypothetical protein
VRHRDLTLELDRRLEQSLAQAHSAFLVERSAVLIHLAHHAVVRQAHHKPVVVVRHAAEQRVEVRPSVHDVHQRGLSFDRLFGRLDLAQPALGFLLAQARILAPGELLLCLAARLGRASKAVRGQHTQRRIAVLGFRGQRHVREKSLALPAGSQRAKPLSVAFGCEGDFRRVVDRPSHALLRASSHRLLHMRLHQGGIRNPLVADKPVEPLQLRLRF